MGEDLAAEVALARALFPGLADELDAALDRAGGSEPDPFERWLSSRTADFGTAGGTAAAYRSELPAPVLARFERAFAETVAVFPDLRVPGPESFSASGTDFARLGAALALDPTLEPVIAPLGLDAPAWKQLFEAAGSVPEPVSTEVSESASAAQDALGPAVTLTIAGEAAREFAVLAGPRSPAGGAAVDLSPADLPSAWTLRLIPAGLAPAVLGQNYAHGPHASLPEMLTLQLIRLHREEPLVDARSFTWLDGTIADGKLAARHVYDDVEHTIRITCREVGNQGPHLGARPPVA